MMYWVIDPVKNKILRKTNAPICATHEIIIDVTEWPEEAKAKYEQQLKENKIKLPKASAVTVTKRLSGTVQTQAMENHFLRYDFSHLTQKERDKLKITKGRELIDLLAHAGYNVCCEDAADQVIQISIKNGRL